MIASVGADREGNSYNINADEAAGAVARALGAYKIMFLTDVAGWLGPPTGSVISEATAGEVEQALATVAGGMRPKLAACLEAIHGGVSYAHIVDGRVPHSLLLELFTDAGPGDEDRDRGVTAALAELQQLERAHVIGDVRAQPGPVRARLGLPACGTTTATSTSTSSPGSRCSTSATATRAWSRRSPQQASAADPRHEPLLHRARDAAVRAPVGELARRQGVPLQQRRGGERGGDQARPPRAARRRDRRASTAAFTAARTARCRRRRRSRSRRRSRRSCRGSASSRRTPRALDAAVTDATAAVLLEPIQGETASTCSHDELLTPRARRATGPAPR